MLQSMTPGFLLLEISSCVGINQECHNYTCINELKTKYKLYKQWCAGAYTVTHQMHFLLIRFFFSMFTHLLEKKTWDLYRCTYTLTHQIPHEAKINSIHPLCTYIYPQTCHCLFLTDCNIGVKWVESISKEISMMYVVSTCALWWGAVDVTSPE